MMLKLFKNGTVTTGLAIFSMFFGAGNVVFPLVIGRYAGDKNLYAVLGFMLTAVAVPLLGLVSMVLFNGDYKKFFGRLGSVPAMFIITTSLCLIGPFGAIPRCVALSYSTMQSILPGASLFIFSLVSCIVIYFLAINRGKVIGILGRVLSPLLIITLLVIIIMGFINGPSAASIDGSRSLFFLEGLVQGYGTMDIFGAFFFAGVVLAGLRTLFGVSKGDEFNPSTLKHVIWAGVIGTSMLGVVYAGFSYVSAFYNERLVTVADDALISAVSFFTLGSYGAIFACLAVALACLTTAIALAVVFADFIQKDIFKNRIGYTSALAITMAITLAISNFGFAGIMAILVPILSVCYPALIVLAFINIAYKLWNVQIVKLPVFGTFAVVLVYRIVQFLR